MKPWQTSLKQSPPSTGGNQRNKERTETFGTLISLFQNRLQTHGNDQIVWGSIKAYLLLWGWGIGIGIELRWRLQNSPQVLWNFRRSLFVNGAFFLKNVRTASRMTQVSLLHCNVRVQYDFSASGVNPYIATSEIWPPKKDDRQPRHGPDFFSFGRGGGRGMEGLDFDRCSQYAPIKFSMWSHESSNVFSPCSQWVPSIPTVFSNTFPVAPQI